jgi:hypothetical protein
VMLDPVAGVAPVMVRESRPLGLVELPHATAARHNNANERRWI